jgi:hypothetical protein
MTYVIIGALVGALVACFAVIMTVYICLRNRREKEQKEVLINGLICECKRVIIEPGIDSLVPDVRIERVKLSPEEIKVIIIQNQKNNCLWYQ